MGKYFADFFERNGYKVLISDKGTPLANKTVAQKSDVLVVSVPIEKTQAVIDEIAPHVGPSSLLMDLTSLKQLPVAAMLKSRASVIGLHPLFGPHNSIEGQVVVMCPARPGKWKPWLKKLLESNQVAVRELTPKAHDHLMAYVQVLSHFTEVVLAKTLEDSGLKIQDFLKYQSPAYRLKLDMMGRILNQSPDLYAQIQVLNPESSSVLNSFLKNAKRLAGMVHKKDSKAFADFFKKGAKYLGEFTQDAMEESNRLIDLLYSDQLPAGSSKILKGDLCLLGPQNTYSDVVARRCFPKAKIVYAPTIAEVFELLKKKRVKKILVPIENSLSGSVREALDELYGNNVHIESAVKESISLALVAPKNIPFSKIEAIYSHPQALLQTRRFLSKHLKKAALLPLGSTVAALDHVKQYRKASVAAIASAEAAKAMGLTVLKDSIEDASTNNTLFATVSSGPTPAKATGKRLFIAFHFDKDSPGSLSSILQTFAGYKVNLTKIESRPNPLVRGQYVFYIELEGSLQAANVQKALREIRGKVGGLKVVGNY